MSDDASPDLGPDPGPAPSLVSRPPDDGDALRRAERQALLMFWTMVVSAATTVIAFVIAVVNLVLSFF